MKSRLQLRAGDAQLTSQPSSRFSRGKSILLKKSYSVEPAQDRLLTTKETLVRLGISRATLYRGAKSGIYPRPVQIGTRSIRWRNSDIQLLIARGVK